MRPSLVGNTFVTIYKTNVTQLHQAQFILEILAWTFPESNFHLDLEDSDHVFRMETGHDINEEVLALFEQQGFRCEVL